MSQCFGVVILGAATLCLSTGSSAAGRQQRDVAVMTYNVHGLPWPIAKDRSAALAAIGTRLKEMRSAGQQPDIVALQEAFVPEAKAIGAAAGYRYVVFGAPAEAPAFSETRDDRRFASAGSMLRGERIGKHVGSGLAIFSDYPIVATRRISFPVCAGYDCLANKGALAAELAVPDVGLITVIDTHLNSNAAAGVAEPRALHSFERQIDVLGDFIRSVARPDGITLIAGDFNVGRDVQRRSYFAHRLFGGSNALVNGLRACETSRECAISQSSDVALSARRAKDWLIYRASGASAVRPTAFGAPFGRNGAGTMLSDHIGIMLRYDMVVSRSVPDLQRPLSIRISGPYGANQRHAMS